MKNQKTLKKRPRKENIETEIQNSCPDCNSTDFDYNQSRGEVICKHCGLIIDENVMDFGPEWRAFDHEQRNRRTRVGAPTTNTIHDYGLPTTIDWKNNNISSKNLPQWYRMRKWQKKIRVSGARERNLAFALTELDRKCSNLGLSRNIRESASLVYRKALDNNLIRGRTIQGVVAASIYISCRLCDLPRTLGEVANALNVTKKELGRVHRFLVRKLKIKLSPISPKSYIPRFACELKLSEKSQVKAIEIIEKSQSEGLTIGKGPNGVAAAALYIASQLLGERKSQRDVAEVAGVTEVTLRNRYKELCQNLNLGVTI
ncbi:transcription initiation factor IIB [Methanobrevibacter millerae]|uniref:Transcription initiation factor IIB n=1 Tax=Methanobrevibacter millerae TaxID=230361 RepID=A0A1G5VLK8_9EURY|nr:transcription initiation factor IIB [Methanobrevibacter millerae]SDA46594.1 transcription initiation factor TFIIB [Methanobrevibacter millerae]